MCLLTERQQRILYGLKQMGIIYCEEETTDTGNSLYTLEDVLSLYHKRKDSGDIFKKNGDLTTRGRKAYQQLYDDLCKVNQQLPEEKRIDIDKVESEIDRIIRLGM